MHACVSLVDRNRELTSPQRRKRLRRIDDRQTRRVHLPIDNGDVALIVFSSRLNSQPKDSSNNDRNRRAETMEPEMLHHDVAEIAL